MMTHRNIKMSDKIILTDCDGVLLDWETAFHKWMESHGHVLVAHGMYDICEQYGMEKPVGKELIKIFNESAWIGYLKAYRDARSGVAKLYEHGYRFHCITSLSLDKKSIRLRRYNLENIFGKGTFKEIICLDTGSHKDKALSEYVGSETYWIEDKLENAEDGARIGLKSILLTHNHNENEELTNGIQRANDWSGIVDIIVNNKCQK